jgi:hypothetical protein
VLQVVPPGFEWPVLLTLRAPSEPGKYVGEIDLVHEGISCNGHKGSPTLRFTIEVTHSALRADQRHAAMMQEYPIPRYPEGVLPSARAATARFDR